MPLTQVQAGMMDSTAQYYSFKNRIINGAMVIDQRNAGASISATGYPVDRFSVVEQTSATFTAQQSTTAPAGFVNSLLITIGTGAAATSTQYAVTGQSIEGLNCTDLGFGSASAQAVTLSFWVRSSLTGVYCASIRNSGGTRAYIKEYTISSANTWEYKTLTFPGDVSGTWLTTNGIGITVYFDLGSGSGTPTGAADSWVTTNSTRTTNQTNFVGTSGATFYITGVQLEKGSTATSFDYRPYGTELILCQRYYQKSYAIESPPGSATTLNMAGTSISGPSGAGNYIGTVYFVQTMRTTPTLSYWDGNGNASRVSYVPSAGSTTFTHNITPNTAPFNLGASGFLFYGSNSVANYSNFLHYAASSEL